MQLTAVRPAVRFMLVLVCVAIFAFVTWQFARFAHVHSVDPGSPFWGWFGVQAVVVLWFLSAILTGNWNPLALAVGADNRLSTSKFQVLLWTATVGFVYVMIYADRAISVGRYEPLTQVPQNVLIALGISISSAIAAQAITGTQAAEHPETKTVKAVPSYDPSALVRDDEGATASLTKVQLLFWTVVAIVVYLVTAFDTSGTIVTCVPSDTKACGLPDIDSTLMLFMGLGHATYIGGKLATNIMPRPAVPNVTIVPVDVTGAVTPPVNPTS